jgi:hypothetical protein
MFRRLFAVAFTTTLWLTTAAAQPAALRLETDEAVAALRILGILTLRREPSPAQWSALFSTDGYRRLQRREASMGRAFTDSSFAAFLRADSTVARAPQLRRTLAEWQRMNVTAAAAQAAAWLPRGARIRATIYLLIKPRTNSFVFETDTDPAIMLYLDPAKSVAEYTNHVVHELHHIGVASSCPVTTNASLTAGARVRTWLGAFSEGHAMLAAAGSLTTHPHAVSPADDRARWDKDVANFDADLRRIEAFVRDALDGTTPADSIGARAQQFYGVQGPWYTVGYTMAAVVGTEQGVPALLASMCHPLDLMTAFNAAAAAHARRTGVSLATWDASLLARIRSAP